ncbi:hypothetical protein [Streptomyces viridosporus]|uniref:hypothetical protein n=1 Tax=Streptomyces viridosporus TaxID=67581 RepID=UPI00333409B7
MAATTPADRTRRAGTRRRAGAAAALTLLAAVTALGCGGPDEQDGTFRGGDGRVPQSRSASPSPKPPSAGRAARAEPSVPAADGHDVGACADGNCEIAVSEPVTLRFGGPAGSVTLSVTGVGPNRIEYTVKSGNGRSRAGVGGPGQGCLTVLRGNGSGTSCGPVGTRPPRAETGAVVVRAATGEDGTALLHVVSG